MELLTNAIGIGVGTLIYDRYISKKEPDDIIERAIFVGVVSSIILCIF